MSIARADIAHWLRDIQSARARLAPLLLAELLVRLPGEAARATGHERALVLLIRDEEVVPAGVHDDEQPELAADFLRVARAMRLHLDDLPLEAEVARRRRPLIVAGAQREPRAFRPLVGLSDTPGYVVAPLVHPDRTIALLFADRRRGPVPDELDRELVWMFASLAAPLVHLATLAAFARAGEPALAAELPPAGGLTRREVEVLRLMAQGASNAVIAERLVISETTVKTHVRQILRKLGAADRTEAASRYAGGLRPGAFGT